MLGCGRRSGGVDVGREFGLGLRRRKRGGDGTYGKGEVGEEEACESGLEEGCELHFGYIGSWLVLKMVVGSSDGLRSEDAVKMMRIEKER